MKAWKYNKVEGSKRNVATYNKCGYDKKYYA